MKKENLGNLLRLGEAGTSLLEAEVKGKGGVNPHRLPDSTSAFRVSDCFRVHYVTHNIPMWNRG